MLDSTLEQDSRDFWRPPIVIEDLAIGSEFDEPTSELALMADLLPTLCWMAKTDGHIFWYNKRWHDYCQTTPEEMDGWGWQQVHDPAVLPSVIEKWTNAIESGEPFEMVFPLKGGDGIFRPFLTRVVPIRNPSGIIVRWFGVNTEISAQVLAERALEASEAKYQVLTNAMPQMVWSTLPDGYHDYYNEQWYEFTGVSVGSTDGEEWNGMFHPDDQERAWAKWRACLESGEPYEIEYRLRHNSGAYRWVLGRAKPVRGSSGEIVRWIGTCTEIHQAKLESEQNKLLNLELSHRIKNIFAVVSGLISLSARRADGEKPILDELLSRVGALGRAHNFARPQGSTSTRDEGKSDLQRALVEILEPYGSNDLSRITINGGDVIMDDQSATPLALTFHEFATNSAKYGALSTPAGKLKIDITTDGENIELVWIEQGGPLVEGPPARSGFGTDLARLSIEHQLGGSIEREWRPEGLKIIVKLKEDRLHRSL